MGVYKKIRKVRKNLIALIVTKNLRTSPATYIQMA